MTSEDILKQLGLFCELYDIKEDDFILYGEANFVLRDEIFNTDEIELAMDIKTIKRLVKKHDTLTHFMTHDDVPKYAARSFYFTGISLVQGTFTEFETREGIRCLPVRLEENDMSASAW